MRTLFPHFFITVTRKDLENISLIEVWNHRVVCWHKDCRLQLSCSGLWEFVVPYSNPVVLKKKDFLGFLFHLWNLQRISNIFKKKTIVLGNVFAKLATVQVLVTLLTIQRRLKTSFDSQHVKRFQTLVKSSWEHFYYIFSSLWGERISKTSPWLKFRIIGLFVNTRIADYKCPVPDCEKLSFSIQIQLS